MTHGLFVTSAAEEDLAEAWQWYQEQRVGLGEEFVRCVDSCLESIQRSPDQYPLIWRTVRRALVRRFPFCIFYILDRDRIVILAVFHGARDPGTWQRRV